MRIFRILRLTAYVSEYQVMGEALWASRRKVLVFLAAVLMIDLVMGTLMYVVEGPENGFRHPDLGVLGDHRHDHRRLWRHHAQDRPRPLRRLGHDAGRLGTLAVPTGIVTAR